MKGKSVRREVESLMAQYKKYRNDDKALIIKVWQMHGLELTPYQKYMFFQAPGADVILRRRREFSGKYPASAAVTEKRYKHYTEYKEEYSRMNYPELPEPKVKRSILRMFRRKSLYER